MICPICKGRGWVPLQKGNIIIKNAFVDCICKEYPVYERERITKDMIDYPVSMVVKR
jgi:hypothetical protein